MLRSKGGMDHVQRKSTASQSDEIQAPEPATSGWNGQEATALVSQAAPFATDPVARFIRRGRLIAFPAKRKNRLSVLAVLAETFHLNQEYTEDEVNRLLLRYYDDYCTLRRALVDERYLQRTPSGTTYRRLVRSGSGTSGLA